MSNRRRLRRAAPARGASPDTLIIDDPVRDLLIRESAAVVVETKRVQVAEATTSARMKPTGKPRRYRARLIEGDRWGTSGYYPRKVVERDGPDAWPAGTLMYLDHPTPTQEAERPERSVRDLAAKTVTSPVYEGDGLYADIEVFPHTAALVEALADTIGLSVRGEGTARFGEAAGREGMIIESLDRGYSVDFVTRAGAGGKIVSLLESARAHARQIREARNIGAWIESRLHLGLTQLGDDMYGNGYLTRDERIALSGAVGDALQAFTAKVEADAPQLFQRDLYDDPDEPEDMTAAGEQDPGGVDLAEARRRKLREASSEDIRRVLDDLLHDAYPTGQNGYLWVRDYDADRRLVWFEMNPDDDGDCGTYQQGYAVGDNGQLSLTGSRVEVVARTDYTPVTPDTEDVAESARPPAPGPASTIPSTTGGAPPTAIHPPTKEPIMGTENTGPAPGAAGTADGGQATPVNEAALQARLTVTEAQRDEAVARAQALTEARAGQAQAIAERDSLQAENRRIKADGTASRAIARMVAEAANIPDTMRALIAPRVADRILGRVPLAESGEANTQALEAAITSAVDAESTYAAAILEAAGAGRVKGLGGSLRAGEMSEADAERELLDVFTDIGLTESDAKIAAKGR